jgi:hypothetical protein
MSVCFRAYSHFLNQVCGQAFALIVAVRRFLGVCCHQAGDTALLVACCHGCLNVAEWLVMHAGSDARSERNNVSLRSCLLSLCVPALF